MNKESFRWLFWPAAVVLVLGCTFVLWRQARPRHSPVYAGPVKAQDDDPDEGDEKPGSEVVSVKVIKPRRGAMERITTQVGSVQAESVQLHAKVSGYLKSQGVDIGDRVKKDQVLAIVDVPELEKIVEKNGATVELYDARVAQMKAKVAIAKADVEAAKAQTVQAEANAKAAVAAVSYHSKYYDRMKDLSKLKSIEDRVVDEARERYEAAVEKENAARAAIITSKAQVMSAEAKVLLADADVGEASAQVKVAHAELDRSKVQVGFARISAPFDGVITQRTFFPGDFVRSAGETSMAAALLTVQRIDRMRVIVQIPDRDVPYADPGDTAIVEIDAYPGEKFPAKVSRIARAEDLQTRLMPVEIDLPNPDGKIRQGMFGKVTILLDPATKMLSIPSTCLKARLANDVDIVYVVREGKARRTKIKIGTDNGQRVEVLSGLSTNDEVIAQSAGVVVEGAEVQAARLDEDEQNAGPQR